MLVSEQQSKPAKQKTTKVLILILLDVSLGAFRSGSRTVFLYVLILILLDVSLGVNQMFIL